MAESSNIKDFFAFLSTIRGDLANITSPPYFLAPQSVAEVASCWTERPSTFVAPVSEPVPQKRALLVVKWILSSLKAQFYVGQDSKAGIKKPLNAFLGELFRGQWTDDGITSKVLTEQVRCAPFAPYSSKDRDKDRGLICAEYSHHPPITACYMWNNEHGIRGEGYTRVEMNFNGNINIKQTGHAMVHIDRFDEDYLIPMPNAKVKGFLSGSLYPELYGTYHIISSTGFVTEIVFSGKGYFSGMRNSFHAKMFHRGDQKKNPIYTIRGQWSGNFTIHECSVDKDVETWGPDSAPRAPLELPQPDFQDPWETRRAWKKVIEALQKGDMYNTIAEKSKVEEAQRAMRKKEASEGTKWQPVFFAQKDGEDALFQTLASATNWKLCPERTKGIWKVDRIKAEQFIKPFHGELEPLG